MRLLVFLLVLANVLFYAYGAGYLGHSERPDAGRAERQVVPERLIIVSHGEPPPLPAPKPRAEPVPAVPAPPPSPLPDGQPASTESEPAKGKDKEPPARTEAAPASVCLNWKSLGAAEADKASALFAKRFGDYRLTRKVVAGEPNGWWVYVPPLPSRAEADKKAGELRALGVSEFFILPDGPARNAISLGIFSAEKGAQDRLAELKGKGVRSALAGPRPGKDSSVSIVARGPAGQKAAVIAAVAEIAPKTDVLACQ